MTEQIIGSLERIVFEASDATYIVGRLKVRGRRDLVTVVGNLSARPGETLRLDGRWSRHRKYGSQFQVERFETLMPASADGIEKYLGSGLIDGIGKIFARRIVNAFGTETFDVIDRRPQELLRVEGIGRGRLKKIRGAWQRQKAVKQVVMFLQEHDVPPTWAARIFRVYGNDSLRVLKDNPYRLASEVRGVGFRTADRMARKMGVAKEAPIRLEEGVAFVLGELAAAGHVYYPREELLKAAGETLEAEPARIEPAMASMAARGRLKVDEDRIYLSSSYEAEAGVARRLADLLSRRPASLDWEADEAIDWVEKKNGLRLADLQREALRVALGARVMVITGNPGCGKSTLVKSVVDLFVRKGKRVALAAPTGRAAKRLSELADMEARTIHRLLEFRKGRFTRNEGRPVEADLLIVDEASMIDLQLMNHLIKAVSRNTSLIFVGDVDQLPSVGAGNVLRDLIASSVLPVVALTEIFRQARESMIVVNAHRIHQGERPVTRNDEGSDFFFIEEEEPERIAERIADLVVRRLPRHYRVNPVRDIQVLSPMHRGEAGVAHLNALLQERLNPDGKRIALGGRDFRVGDKVIQNVNNYDLDVFNGDLGLLTAVDEDAGVIHAEFDGRSVVYGTTDLDELSPAYACSVHKSQGSEYPVVVIPVHTQHYIMLQRNLLYTAITRARRLCVLVGTRKALAIAIRNDRVQQRCTALAERLKMAVAGDKLQLTNDR